MTPPTPDELRETWQMLYSAEELEPSLCDDACSMCERALRSDPRSVEAWVLKAQSLLHFGDAAAALGAARMAVLYGPEQPECHYVQSLALMELGYDMDALRAVTRGFHCANQRTSDSLMAALYYQRAVLLGALGRNQESWQTAEEGLARYPNSRLLRAALQSRRRAKLGLTVLGGRPPDGLRTRE